MPQSFARKRADFGVLRAVSLPERRRSRLFLRVLLPVVLSLVLPAAVWGQTAPAPVSGAPAEKGTETASAVTVTIYSTGDLHERTANLPKIAAYVKAQREKDLNVLLVDAGDLVATGEKEMFVTRGEGMTALLAAAGYDACILGNHDYRHGKPRWLELCAKYPKFPLLMANVVWEKDESELAKRIPPYRVFQLKGVNVAVIGTASSDFRYAVGKRFSIVSQPDTIQKLVPLARKEAPIVVALTHQYDVDDWTSALGPDPPDVILGGHDHGVYSKPWGMRKNLLLLKPGPYGWKLGKVTIVWDGKKIVERKGEIIPVGKDWPDDPAVKALREQFLRTGGEELKRQGQEPKKPAKAP